METEELPADFQLRRVLKPLLDFKKLKENIFTTHIFSWVDLLVITFVRSAGSPTQGAWRFLKKVSRADIRLVELKKTLTKENEVILFGKDLPRGSARLVDGGDSLALELGSRFGVS